MKKNDAGVDSAAAAENADVATHCEAPRTYLGRYQLLELIGSGAMGNVYRATHSLLGRPVAVKLLRPEFARDQQLAERFFAEARAVNLIGHPHIVEISDFAREPDGTVWFVMELLEGVDLAELRNNERLSMQRAVAIVRQICDALAAVHETGIVHRDIKPENVFIVQREGSDFVKLLDFGIAQLPNGEPTGKHTPHGCVMGTPPYMAPEQACGDEVDHRSDLYAVGAILFELLTGRLLFSRSSIRQLLVDVAYTAPPRLSECMALPDEVRDDLDRLLQWCLSKQPENRPQSAADLAAALAAVERRLSGGEAEATHQPAMQAAKALDESLDIDVELDAFDGQPARTAPRPERTSAVQAAHRSAPWAAAAIVALGVAAGWQFDLTVAAERQPATSHTGVTAAGVTAVQAPLAAHRTAPTERASGMAPAGGSAEAVSAPPAPTAESGTVEPGGPPVQPSSTVALATEEKPIEATPASANAEQEAEQEAATATPDARREPVSGGRAQARTNDGSTQKAASRSPRRRDPGGRASPAAAGRTAGSSSLTAPLEAAKRSAQGGSSARAPRLDPELLLNPFGEP